jgi:hypothetical protein
LKWVTVQVKACVLVALASDAITVTACVTLATDIVPEMSPVAGLRVSPGGSPAAP